MTLPPSIHFKLSKDQCPIDDTKIKNMKTVPYSNVVGSVLYTIVCTRPDIVYAIGNMCRLMVNPGLE